MVYVYPMFNLQAHPMFQRLKENGWKDQKMYLEIKKTKTNSGVFFCRGAGGSCFALLIKDNTCPRGTWSWNNCLPLQRGKHADTHAHGGRQWDIQLTLVLTLLHAHMYIFFPTDSHAVDAHTVFSLLLRASIQRFLLIIQWKGSLLVKWDHTYT